MARCLSHPARGLNTDQPQFDIEQPTGWVRKNRAPNVKHARPMQRQRSDPSSSSRLKASPQLAGIPASPASSENSPAKKKTASSVPQRQNTNTFEVPTFTPEKQAGPAFSSKKVTSTTTSRLLEPRRKVIFEGEEENSKPFVKSSIRRRKHGRRDRVDGFDSCDESDRSAFEADSSDWEPAKVRADDSSNQPNRCFHRALVPPPRTLLLRASSRSGQDTEVCTEYCCAHGKVEKTLQCCLTHHLCARKFQPSNMLTCARRLFLIPLL